MSVQIESHVAADSLSSSHIPFPIHNQCFPFEISSSFVTIIHSTRFHYIRLAIYILITIHTFEHSLINAAMAISHRSCSSSSNSATGTVTGTGLVGAEQKSHFHDSKISAEPVNGHGVIKTVKAAFEQKLRTAVPSTEGKIGAVSPSKVHFSFSRATTTGQQAASTSKISSDGVRRSAGVEAEAQSREVSEINNDQESDERTRNNGHEQVTEEKQEGGSTSASGGGGGFGDGPEVFLGGSCNPTTWRADVAIPTLNQLGISFYNPQVSDWTPDLIELEHRAKEKARVLFFVMDSETRATAGAIEAAHIAGLNTKQLVLVLHPYKPNQKILNETVSKQ